MRSDAFRVADNTSGTILLTGVVAKSPPKWRRYLSLRPRFKRMQGLRETYWIFLPTRTIPTRSALAFPCHPRQAAHPSNNKPLATIQLPATRTAILAHGGRSLITNADTSATTTKIPPTNPAYALTSENDHCTPAPFIHPCTKPSRPASTVIVFFRFALEAVSE